MVEYIVAIDVTRVRFPADAFFAGVGCFGCPDLTSQQASQRAKTDPGRTRTYNLRFRRPMPYPLGHRAAILGKNAAPSLHEAHGKKATSETSVKWNRRDLNPGPFACKANVIPLHHDPFVSMDLFCVWNGYAAATFPHPGRYVAIVWDLAVLSHHPAQTTQQVLFSTSQASPSDYRAPHPCFPHTEDALAVLTAIATAFSEKIRCRDSNPGRSGESRVS